MTDPIGAPGGPLLQKSVTRNSARCSGKVVLLALALGLGFVMLWSSVPSSGLEDDTVAMAEMQRVSRPMQAQQPIRPWPFMRKPQMASQGVLNRASTLEKPSTVPNPQQMEPRPSDPFWRPKWVLDSMYESFKNNFLNVEPITAETQGWAKVVEGKIPVELTGTLMRNGPALFERDGFKKPFLDGDGMVASVAFKDGKAYFRNSFVRTDSFKKEQEEGRFSELSIFTPEDPRPKITGKPLWYHRLIEDIFMGPPTPKFNGAYNVWYWGGSLVAVDFAKPHGLDKNTLETVGPYSEFSEESFTAHSRLMEEPDGSKRLVCFSPFVDWAKRTTYVTFLEFDEAGKKVVESKHQFQAAYFHDIIVTDKWYILYDTPIDMDYKKAFVGYPMGENSLGDTLSEDKSRLPMFRMFPRPGKNNRKPVTCYVRDLWAYAYHHINGFDVDETGTKVIFDTITWDKFNLYFNDIIEPDGKTKAPRTKLTRFFIDTETQTATSKTLSERPCEAPTVAPDATGVPYKHAYMTTSSCYSGEHWHDGCSSSPMHSLTKVTISSTGEDAQVTESSWVPSDTAFVGEPLFVARPGATEEDDGWVIMPLHETEGPSGPHTEVAIMDAKRVADGPVARLQLPAYVPMGVHGSFTEHYILGPNAADDDKSKVDLLYSSS